MVNNHEKGQLGMRVRLVTFGKERGTHELMCLKHSTFLTSLNLTSVSGCAAVENQNKKINTKM